MHFFRRQLLLALCIVIVSIANGFGAEKSTAADTLPKHPVVVIPGPDVPSNIAALSGSWEGTWSNGKRSILVVYRVEKERASLLHAFGEGGDSLAWHQWVRARVAPGERPRLEWKTDWASGFFELSPDGKNLSGVYRESQREGGNKESLVVMKHRDSEQIGADRLGPPFVCPETGRVLQRMERENDQTQRKTLVDAFMARAKSRGTPLVEPGSASDKSCVTFLYRGAGNEVGISGDMNGWSEQKDFMSRVAGTDLFYFSEEYPADSRIEYKLVSDGVAKLDFLNPRVSVYGKGSNSEAPMTGYKPPPEVESAPVAARGVVEEYAIASKQPGMSRTATVYLPVGYSASSERYPVLYLNDAFGAIKFGAMINVFDNLIHEKAIPPFIAVLIPSVGDRIAEYSMNPVFEAFMVGDVIPAIDRRYRTLVSREFRAVGGISAGATAALSLTMRHSDVFGKCMAQSTATMLAPLIALVRNGPKLPVRVYLDVGRFEADFNGKDLVEASHRIRDALAGHGCPVHLREVNEGHGWKNWRARTREALTFLFNKE